MIHKPDSGSQTPECDPQALAAVKRAYHNLKHGDEFTAADLRAIINDHGRQAAQIATLTAENERLTAIVENLRSLEKTHREQRNIEWRRANKAESDRDEARTMLKRMEGFDCCSCGPCAIHGDADAALAELRKDSTDG